MKLIVNFRAVVILSWITMVCSTSQAELTAVDLIGSVVDKVDDRYSSVSNAVTQFQQGNGPAALGLLKDANKQHPELPPGEVLFARLCFSSGNIKVAQDTLQSAALTAKDDPEVWNMLADLQLREGHLAEADLIFTTAAKVAENYQGNSRRRTQQYISAHAGAALANERRGLWREAEVHLLAWQKVAPTTLEIQTRLAIVLLNTERYAEATRLLDQLRERTPGLLASEVILGMTYERQDKPELARQTMQFAMQKYSNDFATLIAVGRWALGAGEIEMASQCASRAAAIDKTSHLPDLIAAQVYYMRGDFAKSEATYRKVYQNKPGNYDTINGLALSILAQPDASRYSLGLEYAELIAKSNANMQTPAGRQAATVLAWALYRSNRADEAQKLMNAILANGPVSPEGAYFAAKIYSKQGQRELADEALKKALIKPQMLPYLAEAGELKKELGNTKSVTR